MAAFLFSLSGSPMAALVVHASKDGESIRTLFTSPVLAVAKARGLFKTGWQVHIVDADGRCFIPKSSTVFSGSILSRRPNSEPAGSRRRVLLCPKETAPARGRAEAVEENVPSLRHESTIRKP